MPTVFGIGKISSKIVVFRPKSKREIAPDYLISVIYRSALGRYGRDIFSIQSSDKQINQSLNPMNWKNMADCVLDIDSVSQ